MYAAVLGLWFLAGVTGADDLVAVLVWVAVPVALATAGYTAFLFGQAEGRDLWQSPILLWHMVAGAFAGWMAVYSGTGLWAGVCVAMLVGMMFGLIHSLLTVPFGV